MAFHLRRWAGSGILLAVSLALAALLAEGLTRLVVDPVDYLAVDPVPDPVLRLRLPPHAGGHDAWGFRNRTVPEEAEIVTIGDSQTYGMGAPASSSWPSQLGRLLGHRVYNLALGGYSPVQYTQLLQDKALRLRPEIVVVGLYYGNDLLETYQTVYSLDRWAFLRRPELPSLPPQPLAYAPDVRFMGPARHWLANHSVVYRMATSTVLGDEARRLEFATRHGYGTEVVDFHHPLTGERSGLTPAARLHALNLESAEVREGLRLSLDRLHEMHRRCHEAGIHLLVALIPTKERVYQPWVEGRGRLRVQEVFQELFRNESEVDRRVRDFLTAESIPYVSLIEPLRQAAAKSPIFPPNADLHPTADGYGVIARAVAQAVEPWIKARPEPADVDRH